MIIRGICILRRVSKAKNAQGLAKLVAVVDKNSSKRGGNSPPRSFFVLHAYARDAICNIRVDFLEASGTVF